MSKRNHSVIAHEVDYIIKDINRLTKEEALDLHGIELLPNGRVYDIAYDKAFDSIGEWARFNVEEDDMEYEEHFHGKGYGDDY